MKEKRATFLIIMFLISHLQNINSRILHPSSLDSLDSYFDNKEIESAIKKQSKLNSITKKSHNNLRGSMKIVFKNGLERNLRQVKKAKSDSFDLEFKNIGTNKLKHQPKNKKRYFYKFFCVRFYIKICTVVIGFFQALVTIF